MDIRNSYEIGFATFGLLLNGKGYKVFNCIEFPIENKETIDKILQLPLGIEIKRDAEIYSVVKFESKNTKEFIFTFILYKFADLDKDKRASYYASAISFKYSNSLPKALDLLTELEKLNEISKNQLFGNPYELPSKIKLDFQINKTSFKNSDTTKKGYIKRDLLTTDVKIKFFEIAFTNQYYNFFSVFLFSNQNVLESIDKSSITKIDCDFAISFLENNSGLEDKSSIDDKELDFLNTKLRDTETALDEKIKTENLLINELNEKQNLISNLQNNEKLLKEQLIQLENYKIANDNKIAELKKNLPIKKKNIIIYSLLSVVVLLSLLLILYDISNKETYYKNLNDSLLIVNNNFQLTINELNTKNKNLSDSLQIINEQINKTLIVEKQPIKFNKIIEILFDKAVVQICCLTAKFMIINSNSDPSYIKCDGSFSDLTKSLENQFPGAYSCIITAKGENYVYGLIKDDVRAVNKIISSIIKQLNQIGKYNPTDLINLEKDMKQILENTKNQADKYN